MNIHYHTNLNNLRQLAGSSRASLLFSPHIRLLAGAVAGHCVPALRWAVRQRRPRSHGLLLFNRWVWQTTVSGARSLCRYASAPVTTDCDYAIRPSWTPLRRGVNNWRNSPVKTWRLIGCAPGHQVTPRLRALFCAGASGDSPPSRAFPRRGTRWLIAFARFSAQGHRVTTRLCALFRAGASGDSSPSRAFLCRGIRWLPAFARFSAQGHRVTNRLRALFCAGASGDYPPSRAFPRRGIRWLLTFACFSAQGHQVTPRLRALFCAAASGDSSLLRAVS